MNMKRLKVWERLEYHGRIIERRIGRHAATLLWMAVPFFGTVAVIMTAIALRVKDAERSKLFLSIAGYLAALAAFAIGLIQYRRADYWKRCEFLAREMKEFFADPKVSLTLIMIDWGVRRVKLFDAGLTTDGSGRPDSGIREVNREIQCAALRPHTMPRPDSLAEATPKPTQGAPSIDVAVSDEAAEEGEEIPEDLKKIGPWRFSPKEAAIRDCYDRFLDGLDRFGNYLTGELITAEDLRPYLQYWLKEIASAECSATDALWTVYLWAYIDFYSFLGVRRLFMEFGYDISIDTVAATNLATRSSDQPSALKLLNTVKRSRDSKRARSSAEFPDES